MQQQIRIKGVTPSSVALFTGTLSLIVGLVLAVAAMFEIWAAGTVASDSILAGLLFGMSTGILALIVVPLAYFGVGWLVGYVQGLILNVALAMMGGVSIDAVTTTTSQPSFAGEPEQEPVQPAPAGDPATAFGERIPVRDKDRK
jgi:hypothetical protein